MVVILAMLFFKTSDFRDVDLLGSRVFPDSPFTRVPILIVAM